MAIEKDRRNYLFFLIVSSGLATTARGMTLSFLAIKLQQTFGLGPALIGVLLGAGPLVGAVVAPFVGSLSDRAGRKTVLTLTLASMALALVGMGLAETVLAFCLAQIVAATALAVYEPVSRALMSDVCPEPSRLTIFSWRYTAANVGWAVGPLIGLAAGAASTALFLGSGVLYAAFAVILFLATVPRRHGPASDLSAPTVSVFASVKTAIRDHRLAFFVAGGTLLIAVHGQWSATLAPYLSANVEGGIEIFAYLVSINGFVVLLGNPFAKRLIEHVGARNALVVGCVLFLVGELAFLSSSGLVTFALAMTIFTLGEILVIPSEYMLVDDISNHRDRGSYFGAHSFSTIGNFIGPTLGGLMLGMSGGPAMFLLFAGFAAASAALFIAGTKMPPPRAVSGIVGAEKAAPTTPFKMRASFA